MGLAASIFFPAAAAFAATSFFFVPFFAPSFFFGDSFVASGLFVFCEEGFFGDAFFGEVFLPLFFWFDDAAALGEDCGSRCESIDAGMLLGSLRRSSSASAAF